MHLPMLNRLLLLPFWAIIFETATLSVASLASETRPFDDSWRFHLEDHGEAAAMPEFNDSKWEPVTLPHDWAITGPFDPVVDGYAGKLPWKGVGCSFEIIIQSFHGEFFTVILRKPAAMPRRLQYPRWWKGSGIANLV